MISITSKTTETYPGELFRTAANNGNVNKMLSLYRTHCLKPAPELDIKAPGPSSGKTAAHRAAANGHASALRLLHSLGDTFEQKDSEGNTPEQLTTDPKCKQVFALAALGRKALAAAADVFPKLIFVDQPLPLGICNPFNQYRNRKTTLTKDRICSFINELKVSLAKEESEGSALEWINEESIRVFNLIDTYYTLEGAQVCEQTAGACGDRCDVAFTYLSTIAKTSFLVEQIDIEEENQENHDFLLLNRSIKGLSEALIIDSFANQTFFYENFDHIPHPLIKQVPFEKWTIPASNKPISAPPPSGFPPKTLALLQSEYAKWHDLGRCTLEKLLKERSSLEGFKD